MHRPSLILVESNTSGTGALFVERARQLGFSPVLLARDPGRFAFADATLPTITVDSADIVALERASRTLPDIAGVTTSSDYAVPQAAQLAALLGLSGPNPAIMAHARDKAWQRDRLRKVGVDQVASHLVHSASEARMIAGNIGCPVIVKPRKASGSIGVLRCSHPDEVARHVEHLLTTTAPDEGVLVEELIAGAEFSAEIFDGKLVGITAKHLGQPPHFLEIGHDFPASLTRVCGRRIGAFAEQVASTLGLTWGPAHIELRDDGSVTHLVEANPRLAGGFIPELVRHATGIDLIEATLRRVTGLPCAFEPLHAVGAAIRFIVPSAPGILMALDTSGALRVPGIVHVAAYRKPGATLTLRGDFSDRIGHIMTIGADTAEAALAAQRALACVTVTGSDPSALGFQGLAPDGKAMTMIEQRP